MQGAGVAEPPGLSRPANILRYHDNAVFADNPTRGLSLTSTLCSLVTLSQVQNLESQCWKSLAVVPAGEVAQGKDVR